MSRKIGYYLLPILLVITLLIPADLSAEASSDMVNVLVNFRQPPTSSESSLVANFGGTVKKTFTIVPTIAATMPSGNIQALRKDPRVKSIELDTVFKAYFAQETLPWGVDRVDAELVHPTNKGTGVKVAVLDTGIDLDHPDLSVAGDVTFVPGTPNGDDDNGHGTNVAGIIAALDNDIGVIGVAPEAALYSVKVLNSYGDAVMSIVLSGIEWCVTNNMQVINMSFGGTGGMPEAVVDALNAAYDAGIVLVAGAGNGGNVWGVGNNIWYPAGYDCVIAVGATDQQDIRYSSSSTGYQLELMAPGVNIYTTAMGGGYGNMTGTSASSPHAVGVAALLIASGLTNNIDVRYRIRNSAQDLGPAGWDPMYGQGMVNANLAINFSEPPDQTAPVSTISLSGTTGNEGWYRSNVTATLSATDTGGSGVSQIKYSLDSGTTWNTYTSPLTITTEGINVLLARSWDNAGNDEGPPAFVTIKIDKTPPTVTETSNPTTIQRVRKGYLVPVSYSGTASDSVSGMSSYYNTILIDEYDTYSQNLGSIPFGTIYLEAWCKNADNNGRTYTFRLTAQDVAGNQATADAVTTITK